MNGLKGFVRRSSFNFHEALAQNCGGVILPKCYHFASMVAVHFVLGRLFCVRVNSRRVIARFQTTLKCNICVQGVQLNLAGTFSLLIM